MNKDPEYMTDNEIMNVIADAVTEDTPDILDDLISELDFDKPEKKWQPARKKKVSSRVMKIIGGCAAVMVLVFGGISTITSRSAFAVVGLDVNPGIEISVNKSNKVVSAEAVNEDGMNILDGMDLRGSDVKVACNAVIGSMLTHGYLTKTSNSVLLSVRSDENEKGRELEKTLRGDLASFLSDSEISPSVLGQYIEIDDEITKFALDNGISQGKAALIFELANSGNSKLTRESLLKLSTQELILLGQKINRENTIGKADTSKYIGRDAAIDKALKAAGISRAEAGKIEAEFDCDDGVIIYEVEFSANGHKYEIEVDASTGKVIESEKESLKTGKKTSVRDRDDDDDRYDTDDDDDRYDIDDDDDDDRYDADDDDDDDDNKAKTSSKSSKKSGGKTTVKSKKQSNSGSSHDDDDDDDDDDD